MVPSRFYVTVHSTPCDGPGCPWIRRLEFLQRYADDFGAGKLAAWGHLKLRAISAAGPRRS